MPKCSERGIPYHITFLLLTLGLLMGIGLLIKLIAYFKNLRKDFGAVL
jgi:hypothetical protein